MLFQTGKDVKGHNGLGLMTRPLPAGCKPFTEQSTARLLGALDFHLQDLQAADTPPGPTTY